MSIIEFENKFSIGDKVKSGDYNIKLGYVTSIYSKLNWTCDEIEYFEYDVLFVNQFGCNQVERLSEKWISIYH